MTSTSEIRALGAARADELGLKCENNSYSAAEVHSLLGAGYKMFCREDDPLEAVNKLRAHSDTHKGWFIGVQPIIPEKREEEKQELLKDMRAVLHQINESKAMYVVPTPTVLAPIERTLVERAQVLVRQNLAALKERAYFLSAFVAVTIITISIQYCAKVRGAQ